MIEPYYDRDGITIYHGDCLEVIRQFEDKSFSAVVSDPPFGIGFKYDKHKDQNTPKKYWDFLAPIYNEFLRVLDDGGFIALWQASQNFRYFWTWFGDDIHIYAACKNFVQMRKCAINYGFDPVIMKYKAGNKRRPSSPLRNVDFFVANTAAIVCQPNNYERKHPCPRPLDQTTIIVENFSIGNIIDPFMGSGTTLVAAKKLGRRAVGIEISEKYCEIAVKRIEAIPPNLPFEEV